MANWSWSYTNCGGLATFFGPTGSVLFLTGSKAASGSSNLVYYTASVGELSPSTLVLSGNLAITGAISASTYHIKDIAIIDATGSTYFGDGQTDIHARTGSLEIYSNSALVFKADAVGGDVSIADDLSLTSDSAVFNMGAGNDFTITHDGTTGATLAGTPISINSTGDLTLDSSTDIVLDAAGGNFEFKDAGTTQLTIDVDTSAGDIDINLNVDGDDLVFNQYDGTEVLRLTDAASVEVKDNLTLKSDSAVLALGADSDATFTHDGTTGATIAANPLIIDGTATITLSGSTDVRVENDLRLDSDSSVISMGAQNDATLTHDGTTGLTIAATPISINSTGNLTLDSTTDIVLSGSSEVRVENDLRLDSDSSVISMGAQDDATLTHDGTTGLTIAATPISINSTGNLTLDSTTDIVLSGSSEVRVENDLRLDSDSSVISMGAQNDATFTHDGTTGLTIAANPLIIDGTATITLSGSTDVRVENDLRLDSDSSVISMGAQNDATFTHDGTTGLTIAATPISIDSTGVLDLNSTTGDINFQDGGTNQLSLDMDGTAGAIIMQLKVDGDDLVFQKYDGTEVLKLDDVGNTIVGGSLIEQQVAPNDLVNDDETAISVASMLKRIATVTIASSDKEKDTDTAANIVDALENPVANQSFDFIIINLGEGFENSTLTVEAGTGVTLVGSMAVMSEASATFRVRLTNVSGGSEAVTIYRIG